MIALVPTAIHAQVYNYFGSDGVFAGSATVTPYITYIYGADMQPEGFITSSGPRSNELLVPVVPPILGFKNNDLFDKNFNTLAPLPTDLFDDED
jgi:hypothetical protein